MRFRATRGVARAPNPSIPGNRVQVMARLPKEWGEQEPEKRDGPGPVINARWEGECECGDIIYEGDEIRMFEGVALCLSCAREEEECACARKESEG